MFEADASFHLLFVAPGTNSCPVVVDSSCKNKGGKYKNTLNQMEARESESKPIASVGGYTIHVAQVGIGGLSDHLKGSTHPNWRRIL